MGEKDVYGYADKGTRETHILVTCTSTLTSTGVEDVDGLFTDRMLRLDSIPGSRAIDMSVFKIKLSIGKSHELTCEMFRSCQELRTWCLRAASNYSSRLKLTSKPKASEEERNNQRKYFKSHFSSL